MDEEVDEVVLILRFRSRLAHGVDVEHRHDQGRQRASASTFRVTHLLRASDRWGRARLCLRAEHRLLSEGRDRVSVQRDEHHRLRVR